jgi:hypothetical protein
MSLAPYFTKGFWQKNYPIWQDYDAWRSLGLPEMKGAGDQKAAAPAQATGPVKQEAAVASAPAVEESSAAGRLFYGILMGLLSYVLIVKRKFILDHLRKLTKQQ